MLISFTISEDERVVMNPLWYSFRAMIEHVGIPKALEVRKQFFPPEVMYESDDLYGSIKLVRGNP